MLWKKRQPRIYDTFIFGDELDILECRLTEYADTDIYRHVFVEATVDHQGHPKPLYFEEHKDRFASFLDRIIYVPLTDLQDRASTNWGRIYQQRSQIARGLTEAGKQDIILFSDCDEILNPEGVEQAVMCTPALKGLQFHQRMSVFCVDWEAKVDWSGPVAVPYRHAPKDIAQFRRWQYDTNVGHTDYGAGWHLTWLGGPGEIRKKVSQYCHPELDGYILGNLATGRLLEKGFWWGSNPSDNREEKLSPVEVDGEWPRWVRERRCPDSWFRECYSTSVDASDL